MSCLNIIIRYLLLRVAHMHFMYAETTWRRFGLQSSWRRDEEIRDTTRFATQTPQMPLCVCTPSHATTFTYMYRRFWKRNRKHILQIPQVCYTPSIYGYMRWLVTSARTGKVFDTHLEFVQSAQVDGICYDCDRCLRIYIRASIVYIVWLSMLKLRTPFQHNSNLNRFYKDVF